MGWDMPPVLGLILRRTSIQGGKEGRLLSRNRSMVKGRDRRRVFFEPVPSAAVIVSYAGDAHCWDRGGSFWATVFVSIARGVLGPSGRAG